MRLGAIFSIILGLPLIGAHSEADEAVHWGKTLGNDLGWIFSTPGADSSFPVRVDFYLADQIPTTSPCCSGNYVLSIATPWKGEHLPPLALYIPAVGGLKSVAVNGEVLLLTNDDYSSTGPIIPLHHGWNTQERFDLKVEVRGPEAITSGIWKRPPKLGLVPTLIKERDRDRAEQEWLPFLNAVVLLLGGSLFLIIYRSTLKKFKNYLHLGVALFCSACFFLFLSGAVRHVSYSIGSHFHLAARIVLSIGVFKLLCIRYPLSPRSERYTLLALCSLAIVCAGFGLFGRTVIEKGLVVFAGLLSFHPLLVAPLAPFKRKTLDHLSFAVLSWLALASQTSDALKLFDGLIGFKHPLPYLNRFVFAPLLLLSVGNIIVHFAGVFADLKRHLFRLRANTRTSLLLATSPVIEDDLSDFILRVRRIIGVRRASIAALRDDPSRVRYEIISVSGVSKDALGQVLHVSQRPHISETVLKGTIQISDVPMQQGSHWRTQRCAAVPIPERQNPEFLLLLSDPLSPKSLTESDIPYLSQFSSALWNSIEKNREVKQKLRLQGQMEALFKKLDPNLYRFVHNWIERNPESEVSVSEARGMIFFDQKGYSTYLETLESDRAAAFTRHMVDWVAPAVAKFGGRILSFEGDAFLVEVFGFEEENPQQVGGRTLDLVWELVQTLPLLNQALLRDEFRPVNFRFGAHYGRASKVELDFIQSGLTNIIGDNVNVTKRLQQIAPTGRVYLSDALAELARSEYLIKPLPSSFVKGRAQAVPVFELVGRAHPETKGSVA